MAIIIKYKWTFEMRAKLKKTVWYIRKPAALRPILGADGLFALSYKQLDQQLYQCDAVWLRYPHTLLDR